MRASSFVYVHVRVCMFVCVYVCMCVCVRVCVSRAWRTRHTSWPLAGCVSPFKTLGFNNAGFNDAGFQQRWVSTTLCINNAGSQQRWASTMLGFNNAGVQQCWVSTVSLHWIGTPSFACLDAKDIFTSHEHVFTSPHGWNVMQMSIKSQTHNPAASTGFYDEWTKHDII